MSETDNAPVLVACPACSKRLRLRLDAASPERVRVRCPKCDHAFVVRRRAAAAADDWTRSSGAGATGPATTLMGESPSGDSASEVPSPSLAAGSVVPQAVAGSGPRPLAVSTAVPAAPVDERARTRPLVSAGVTAPTDGEQHAFAIGELVAQRWRIIRYVARGGMGEVYEAEDTALKEIVALKTILPEIAANERATERFMREVAVARQVTHRHVCRIHDLGKHASEAPLAARYPNREIPFVTMEMLRGESLAARIARRRYDPDEALELIRQMAAALDAAHAAGIVHRDFKPGNVLLEPTPDGGVRAVVTDFGLARGTTPDSRFAATVTVGDGLLGSPAYMAPEQVDGRSAGPRSDVYAFGTVVYEMVTGGLPFKGDNPLAVAVRRLTENPIAPRHLRPDLDDVWEQAILRALERNPEQRFASAGEMVAALEGRLEAPPTREEREAAARRPPPKRLLLAVVAGLLLALALVLNLDTWKRLAGLDQQVDPDDLGLAVPTTARQVIAVMGLEDLSGDPTLAWLGPALTEMLASELGRTAGVRIVPGEAVARARRDLSLATGSTLASESLGRLRTVLGADFVVVGSYAAIGTPPARQLRLDVKVQDTRAEGRGGATSGTVAEANLFELVAKLGSDLRATLGAESVAAAPTRAINLDAEKLYAEGLARLRSLEPAAARDLLVQAVEVAPADPRPHAALAQVWLALGFRDKAAAAAALALEQPQRLTVDERQGLEVLRLEASGEGGRATERAEELWRGVPDDIDIGLTYARLLAENGRSPEAIQVLAVLERLPSAASSDPRIPLAQATTSAALGDFRRQLESARRAREVAEGVGARGLVARALLVESSARRQLGEIEAAKSTASLARELFAGTGDRPGLVAALSQVGSLAFDAGDLAAAKRTFSEALATINALGDRGAEIAVRNNLAVVSRQLGELDQAEAEYEALLAAAEEIGNRSAVVQALNNRAAVRLQRGDLTGARTLILAARPLAEALGDRALEAATRSNLAVVERRAGDLASARANQEAALVVRRELGHKAGVAGSLADLGFLAFDEGQLATAEATWQEALTVSREIASKRFEANVLDGLGRLARVRGDLVRARESHEEALALRRESGDAIAVTESRLALAELDLAQGQREDAEAQASEVVGVLRGLGAVDAVAEAEALHGLVLVASGRLAEARSVVDRALVRAARTEQPRVAHTVALAAARVAAGQGNEVEARRRLEDTIARAEQLGLVGQRLEAQLMLGQLLQELGDSRGPGLLADVAEEASALGFTIWVPAP